MTKVMNLSKKYSYDCGENKLAGYMYKASEGSKSLIIIVPGFHSKTADYSGVISAFSQNGFDVFCFDSTGHGESGGDSSVGFPQINNDLKSTVEFIQNSDEFDYNDVYLFGHSRGGYAACCLPEYNNGISAIISVNAVDSAMDGIMAYSVASVGPFAYVNYPFLSAYQSLIFGTELSGVKASDTIKETEVPVLVIQAEEDENLAEGGFSLYSQKDKITSDNVSFLWYDLKGSCGHTSILYDDNGVVNKDIVDISSEFFRQNTN